MAARHDPHTIRLAEERYEARSSESFDRIAYAMAVLRVLKPKITVAVYPRLRHMLVEQGRVPNSHGEQFALVGIPAHATREHIARTLAELCGAGDRPYVVDLLSASFSELPA